MLNRPDDVPHGAPPGEAHPEPSHAEAAGSAPGRRGRRVVWAALVLLVGFAVVIGWRSYWPGGGPATKGPQGPRVVSVEVATAEKKVVPVEIDSIGTVTPIASVALKSRLETTIVGVHFEDGARVKRDDVLLTLDSRQLEAQIAQAEGTLAKDSAQLEGAERDRYLATPLHAKIRAFLDD